MNTIYGLFENGRCVYVGRTSNPEQRLAHHHSFLMKGRTFEMRTFSEVQPADAAFAEGEAIREWQANGQAEMNRATLTGLNRIAKTRVSDALGERIEMQCEALSMKDSAFLRVAIEAAVSALEAGTHAVVNGKLQPVHA